MEFELHTQSRAVCPIIEPSQITHAALHTIKVESFAKVFVSTGCKIAKCKPGRIVISVSDEYKDKLDVSLVSEDEHLDRYHNKNIDVYVQNKTPDFIRVEPDEHIFKFTFIPEVVESKEEPTESKEEPTESKEEEVVESKEEPTETKGEEVVESKETMTETKEEESDESKEDPTDTKEEEVAEPKKIVRKPRVSRKKVVV